MTTTNVPEPDCARRVWDWTTPDASPRRRHFEGGQWFVERHGQGPNKTVDVLVVGMQYESGAVDRGVMLFNAGEDGLTPDEAKQLARA
jgi:hypothetical protein